jgi:hypothetical protein
MTITLSLACPACGHVNTTEQKAEGIWFVICGECWQQFAVRGAEVWPHPEETECDFHCCRIEPLGFVPEDGCPVHDRQPKVLD